MKYLLALIVSVLLVPVAASQDYTAVFRSGTEGHKSYRIPAIVRMPDGVLLAFAEGRVNGSNDFGDIDIALKRSTDNGRSWSAISSVVDYDRLQAGNPAPVVDLTDPDFPGGRIFLFYNTGNNHEGEIRKGNGYREVWYKTSVDDGITWSEGVNITSQVHRLRKPEANPAYNFTDDWRSYANTPGHALQISEGKYKGRILVAANHSKGDPQKEWDDYASHAFFSDDHGETFRLSQSVTVPGSNEATAAELSGNGVFLNCRNQKGDIRQRIMAKSSNGGETWDSVWFDADLPDPVCEGSILNAISGDGRSVLAFCNAASSTDRGNLTLRISYDEGMTWPLSIPVDKSPDKSHRKDFTAYSDIVCLSPGEIGVLYERDNYAEIVFRTIKWK
jgi:sialidase-1